MVASAERSDDPVLDFTRISVLRIPSHVRHNGCLAELTPEDRQQRTLDLLSEAIDIVDANDFALS